MTTGGQLFTIDGNTVVKESFDKNYFTHKALMLV